MKKVAKKLVILSLSIIGLVPMSCKKDFLEVTPKGKLIAQKTADYDLILN
ncbi:hypothetical protein [Chitinophaga sp. sic0106]|nr:hypothetical protein [Chitinophaga sp. sic0106]MBV7532177.1 hypothetical protein [Chitinophaga sp. sic0106]